MCHLPFIAHTGGTLATIIKTALKNYLRMRLVISVLACIILLGCNSKNFSKIELISSSGRVLDYDNNPDSLIFGLYIFSYAQVDINGNCSVVRRSYENQKRFNSFKIDNELINLISDRLLSINKDTLLTEISNNERYDGPIIQLFVHKDNGALYKLTYLKSKRTDKDFLRLYKYIDSVSTEESSNYSFDTTRLKYDRDNLIERIKQDIFKSGNTFDRDSIAIIK